MLEHRKKSFSLLEVVFVVAIFLLVIGATISVVGLGYKNLIKNEARWKASILAQNFIEERSVIRDNNILNWLQSDPDVHEYYANTFIFPYNINEDLTCDASFRRYRNYDYEMRTVSYPKRFYELFYQCYPDEDYRGIFIVQVRWSQFNQNYSTETRQFFKNTSGAIH